MNETRITLLKDKLYSLQEVAELLNVSERSIFRYIHGGRLKAAKVGYWRISGKDIINFLEENINIEYLSNPKRKRGAYKRKIDK